MRVQILSVNFAPEYSGTAPYVTGIAKHLSRSHEVTVIAGLPAYPEWKVAPGWRHWRSIERHDHLEIIRLEHYVPPKQDSVRRAGYEVTWAARALAEGLRHPADVVIAFVPALLTSQVGAVVARRHHAAFGVVVQDIASRMAAFGGIKGGSVLAGPAAWVERSGLSRADGVCTIHPRFAEVLASDYAVTPSALRVIYNWSHIDAPAADRSETRRRLGWADDEIVALHSGNMGLKQDLDNVVAAARLASAQGAPVRFVLAGDGNQRARLEVLGAGLTHLSIRDHVAASEFPDFLAAADVLLVNERTGVPEMSLPSKLTSYLVAGRPVIAATEAASPTAELVSASGAGVIAAPGDPQALLDAVLDLGRDPDRAEHLGKLGQQFAFDELSSELALASYQDWVEQLGGR
jgi:colanic acid biosynthesis glycosyl transferase WcaI